MFKKKLKVLFKYKYIALYIKSDYGHSHPGHPSEGLRASERAGSDRSAGPHLPPRRGLELVVRR